MNMLEMMNKITQLSEAVKDTGKGKIHTADPGGYGRKDDEEDEDGKKKATPASTEKKGRGRPKKATQSSGEDNKYDTATLGAALGGGKKPSKAIDKLPKKKHSLKEYFDSLDKALNEAEQIQIKPASQMPKKPGQPAQPAQPGQPQQVAGQPQKDTQVIAQGDKTLGTVDNPQLAAQIKQSIGKGEMTLMPDGAMEEGLGDMVRKVGGIAKKVGGKVLDTLGHEDDVLKDLQRKAGIPAHAQHGKPNMARANDESQLDEKDIGKHNNATTGFDALVRKLTPKYGAEAAKRIAGAQLKKIKEADVPPSDDDMGAGLGAGRSQGVLEARAKADNKAEKAGKKVTKDLEYDMYHKGKNDNKAEKAGKKVTKDIEYDEKHKTNESAKPDFLDMDKDGNKKESMKKAVADKKKMKVKEGMDSRFKAAHHAGKSHALGKQGYNCTFEDMEEARCYHEGYKQGLDECYDQMPIQGYVGEANPAVVDDMASYGAHTNEEAVEESPFSWAAKHTPVGGQMNIGGKTIVKKADEAASPFSMNEDATMQAWDSALSSILSEDSVAEGMTVSISKGQQGQPDSVSINAQDAEADQLLSLVKQAGLGLFGGDEPAHTGSQMSINTDGPESQEPGAEIKVVDDHDNMLSLIRKMTGQGDAPTASSDYEDETGAEEHSHEGTCESCGGMMEAGHSCDENEAVMDEDETLDQREYEVAEDESGGDDSEEQSEVSSDATRDAALAQAAGQNFADTDAPIKEGGDGGEAGTDAIAADDAADEVNAEEEDLDESYANGDDDAFETDIDFMTKVISGGLNKEKSTGQTTIPVVSTQINRLGNPMKESTDLLHDWRSLAGIK